MILIPITYIYIYILYLYTYNSPQIPCYIYIYIVYIYNIYTLYNHRYHVYFLFRCCVETPPYGPPRCLWPPARPSTWRRSSGATCSSCRSWRRTAPRTDCPFGRGVDDSKKTWKRPWKRLWKMVRYGILYGFIWELYGISWDIMGFHDGFIGKLRKWWLNMGCFFGISWRYTGIWWEKNG